MLFADHPGVGSGAGAEGSGGVTLYPPPLPLVGASTRAHLRRWLARLRHRPHRAFRRLRLRRRRQPGPNLGPRRHRPGRGSSLRLPRRPGFPAVGRVQPNPVRDRNRHRRHRRTVALRPILPRPAR